MNGNCTLLIDRFNPLAPPVIYAQRGSVIKVQVVNPSPFETLTLDWKSTTVAIPPDSYSSVFSAISGPLTKGPFSTIGHAMQASTNFVRGGGVQSPFDRIIAEEQALLEVFSLDAIVAQLEIVSQPPPLNACSANNPTAGFIANPWFETAAWKREMESKLDIGIQNFDLKKPELQARLDQLDAEIGSLAKPATMTKEQSDGWDAQLLTIKAIEVVLKQEVKERDDKKSELIVVALKALKVAIEQITDSHAAPAPYPISDPVGKLDSNYEVVTNALSFTNNLAPILKQVSSVSAPSPSPLHSLGEVPSKQPLLNITVQFQTSPRVEVSTGVLVPVRPYHSYSAAAVASSGTITSSQVIETLSYTIVPVAQVNIHVHEFIGHRQRMAFFGSAAVGYNPATSAVEFGLGPTFSIKAIEFSALVDIGRDTRLIGGFTVGESLPASNPPKPPTETYWSVKPAVGLSVRIPLGGATSK